jgi:hypothetical protein
MSCVPYPSCGQEEDVTVALHRSNGAKLFVLVNLADLLLNRTDRDQTESDSTARMLYDGSDDPGVERDTNTTVPLTISVTFELVRVSKSCNAATFTIPWVCRRRIVNDESPCAAATW